MKAIHLSAEQTATWESDGPEAVDFRHNLRVEALNASLESGLTVEVYSCDGVVLDALKADPDIERSLSDR